MSDDQRKLLKEFQARFTQEDVAAKLGFNIHDVPILVSAKLLRPLGNPRKSSVKYFAAVEIYKLAEDSVWLGKATNAIYGYWHGKNGRRRKRDADGITSQLQGHSSR